MTRVADDRDAGALLGPHIHLLRPDPARLDPWFLAGFLGAEDNIASASTGSSLVHVTPGRLRVPLLPLEEQRRYGEAFRRVYELRAAVRLTADLAADTAATLTTGLTAGCTPATGHPGHPGQPFRLKRPTRPTAHDHTGSLPSQARTALFGRKPGPLEQQ